MDIILRENRVPHVTIQRYLILTSNSTTLRYTFTLQEEKFHGNLNFAIPLIVNSPNLNLINYQIFDNLYVCILTTCMLNFKNQELPILNSVNWTNLAKSLNYIACILVYFQSIRQYRYMYYTVYLVFQLATSIVLFSMRCVLNQPLVDNFQLI